VRPTLAILLAASACGAQAFSPEKLIETGHWKRARAIVEPRLREAPDDAASVFFASQIHAAFGDRVSPPALAEKAVRLDPGVARYHRQFAEVQGLIAQHAGIFQQIGIGRRFRKEIDEALRLDPRDAQAMRDLIEYYLVAPGIVGGDVKKAEAVAQRIAAIDACPGFLAEARIAEWRKDSAEQQRMLRSAADVRPPSYKAQMAAAEFFLTPAHRDEAGAEAAARVALSIDSGQAGAYCVLAAIYAGRANWSALDELLLSAAQAVPDDLAPYFRAAERLLADGRDPARAERYLHIYIAQEPEGNEPTLADAHAKLKRTKTGGVN
jgi:hypothetical protein